MGEATVRLLIEVPDDNPHTEWVLSRLHEHGLRLCNDVTCVRVISWRRMPARPPRAAKATTGGCAPLFPAAEGSP